MKLTSLLLFLAFFQVSASVFSQNSSLVQLKASNQTINEVLKTLEEKTNYTFLFNRSNVNVDRKVNVDVEFTNIEDALKVLFGGTNIRYRQFNNNFVLYTEDGAEVVVNNNTQQGRPVRGKVVSSNGEPIPGATVVVKGTTDNGTITDSNGAYTLSNVPANGTLVFSFVGMQTKEVPVKNLTVVDVTMDDETIGLEEVVAIGYGTMKKRDLTGSVASVKSDDITRAPVSNPMEGLQGRVAGLDITRASGQAGAGVTMRLRGTRSFTASGNPLFIIDGMPGDYATLNPNDIESIEVLKDASSTAVYGSAGANGVIIITTKKGTAGKTKVEFNSFYGYNGWSIVPGMRSGDSYLQAIRDANSYVWDATNKAWTTTGASWHTEADDQNILDAAGTGRYQLHLDGSYIDWAKELMQQGVTQNYSLGISGGNERTKAYLSFNYTDEHGQYRGDNYKLYSTNMRIDHAVKEWLKVGANLQGSYVDRDKAYAKLENALAASPLGKVKDDNGNYTVIPVTGANLYNLLLNYQPGVYDDVDNNLKMYFNPYIEIKPMKGLSFLSRASIWMNYSDNYKFEGIGSYAYYSSNGNVAKAYINRSRFYGYKWENILTYNFKIGTDHDFTVTGVTSWEDAQTSDNNMTQLNVADNTYKWHKFDGSANTIATSAYTMYRNQGYVGRLNYSFRSKYLFSASVRRDGSSVLYPTNRWSTFPAFAAGWRVSDEKFMESTKNWLDNLKLRAGYGVTGTAKIDPYSSATVLESGSMELGGTTQNIYRYSKNVTNKDLTWEKSYNTNFGIDMTVLKNRIDFTLDYYDTDTKGVIWSRLLPVIYGGYTPSVQYQTYLNICETNNKGWELALTTRNIETKDFNWTTTLTYTKNKEKIVRLTDGVSNNIINGDYALSKGEAVNSYFNYKLDGVWQLGEEANAAVFGKRPGDLKINVPGMTQLAEGVYYKEATDGTKTYYYADRATVEAALGEVVVADKALYTYSNKDYQILGHNSPDWSVGMQNTFTYKGFDLTVYMFMRYGQMINYKMLARYSPKDLNDGKINIPTYFNYWTPTNPSNDFPVMNKNEANSQVGFGALNYVDGSFFKIKNVTLGYTLPASMMRKLSIDKCRVYGTITNPLVVAKSRMLKQYDPEMNGEIDYPLTKQLVFGVNLTF